MGMRLSLLGAGILSDVDLLLASIVDVCMYTNFVRIDFHILPRLDGLMMIAFRASEAMLLSQLQKHCPILLWLHYQLLLQSRLSSKQTLWFVILHAVVRACPIFERCFGFGGSVRRDRSGWCCCFLFSAFFSARVTHTALEERGELDATRYRRRHDFLEQVRRVSILPGHRANITLQIIVKSILVGAF